MRINRSPAVCVDLLNQVALPPVDQHAMETQTVACDQRDAAVAQAIGRLTGKPTEGTDVTLFEITTARATTEDIRTALDEAGYEMTGIREAVQLLRCGYFPKRQPFPFLCVERDPETFSFTFIAVAREYADEIRVTPMATAQAGRRSHHLLILARRSKVVST